ncbi:MAG: hypothetical protein PHG67_05665 [Bacteroidales bacterium]|nr:hypothetical protein [Bacteroidales bacterium]
MWSAQPGMNSRLNDSSTGSLQRISTSSIHRISTGSLRSTWRQTGGLWASQCKNPQPKSITKEIARGLVGERDMRRQTKAAHSGDTDPHSGILTPYNRSVSQRA